MRARFPWRRIFHSVQDTNSALFFLGNPCHQEKQETYGKNTVVAGLNGGVCEAHLLVAFLDHEKTSLWPYPGGGGQLRFLFVDQVGKLRFQSAQRLEV